MKKLGNLPGSREKPLLAFKYNPPKGIQKGGLPMQNLKDLLSLFIQAEQLAVILLVLLKIHR